jgi:hypothetical protein
VYYRVIGSNRLSVVGESTEKMDAHLKSMDLHIKYIRTVEDSERVRAACVEYLQTCAALFYPERMDIIERLRREAVELGGRLAEPRLRKKYAWMENIFGRKLGKRAQLFLPRLKSSLIRWWDKNLFLLEKDGAVARR